jgi:ABC-type proline/glycine betaine transport system permease subunit
MILSGAIPAALLALTVDGLLGAVERVVRPGGRLTPALASA